MEFRWLKRIVTMYESETDAGGNILFGGKSRKVKRFTKKLQYKNDKGEWVDVPIITEEIGEEIGDTSKG